ncbi:hypothetical protein V2K11_25990, partial [Pseudomonas alliivorans]|nr:hypothetical protein [Pseudomonas alliivorans]
QELCSHGHAGLQPTLYEAILFVQNLDLRHSNLSTTQDTYYHSHDQERMHSIKRLGMRERD